MYNIEPIGFKRRKLESMISDKTEELKNKGFRIYGILNIFDERVTEIHFCKNTFSGVVYINHSEIEVISATDKNTIA